MMMATALKKHAMVEADWRRDGEALALARDAGTPDETPAVVVEPITTPEPVPVMVVKAAKTPRAEKVTEADRNVKT